jgi:phosphopantetheinyl transferase
MAVWKIEEPESFFLKSLPEISLPSHPHKRLQHLAGRFLLQYMLPDFPISRIQSTSGAKPFLPDNTHYFSISHSQNIAAAIISTSKSVGIDIEMITDKANKVSNKFLHESEMQWLEKVYQKIEPFHATLIWSIKETIFKWYGLGNVDFKNDIQIHSLIEGEKENSAACFFRNTNQMLNVNFMRMGNMVVSWLVSSPYTPSVRGIHSN